MLLFGISICLDSMVCGIQSGLLELHLVLLLDSSYGLWSFTVQTSKLVQGNFYLYMLFSGTWF